MEHPEIPLALRLQRDDVKARLFGEPRVSTRFGRYALLRRLGAGGMGVVYTAYDDELDRKVALKLVAADRLGPATVARVRREAQALARLSHPNVVHVYEVGEAEGHAYVAMEFVAGQTLRTYQEAPGRGAEEIVAAYVQAGQGLAAAHAAGLVHRDFKPENALVGDDGRVRVVDFGLALVRGPHGLEDMSENAGFTGQVLRGHDDPDPGAAAGDGRGAAPARLTASGALVGTPAYMAPEQLDGGEADARSDLFAFCAALYEALYGRRPFEGASAAALRRAIAAGVIPPPADERGLPAEVRRALLRGLHEEPAARWPEMTALLAALRRRPAETRRRIITAVLSAMALGACLIGLSLWREGARDDALGRERARARAAEAARAAADQAAARALRRDRTRRLIAASTGAAARDPEAALLYAIEAALGEREAGEGALVGAEEALRGALGGVRSAALVDPGAAAPIRRAALSADGRWAATRDQDGVLRLWHLGAPDRPAPPELRARWPAGPGAFDRPERGALAFTAGGRRLLAARADGVAEVIEGETAARVGTIATGAPAESLVVAPEGARALALAERGAHLLDLTGAEPPRPLSGLSGHVLHASFSPDGERLITIEADGAARLWSGRDGRPEAALRGPTRARGRPEAAWSPGGDRLALVGPGGARIFAVRGGRPRALRSPGEALLAAAFTGDDAAILTLSVEGTLRRFGDEGPLGRVELVGHDAAVGGARFLPGAELLLGTPVGGAIWLWSAAERGEPLALHGHASSVTAALVDDAAARVLSIAHDDPRARVWHLGDDPRVRRGHDGVIERLEWSPDGQSLLSAAMDGTARVWPRGGGPPRALRRHAEESSVVAGFRPDGRMIATASTDGAARLWRLEGGEPELVTSLVGGPARDAGDPGAPGLLDLAWGPGGDRLALAAEDGAVHLWSFDGGDRPAASMTMSFGAGPISHVRFAMGGERLIVADGEHRLASVAVAEFGRSAAPTPLGGHEAAIRGLAVAPDGRRLASAGADGAILLVDLAAGGAPRALGGHERGVWSVAFDPAGRRLVSAGADALARIWDLDDPGAPPVALRGHSQAVLGAAFAPDGAAVLTTAADGSAMIWRHGQVSSDMNEWTGVTLPHDGTRRPGEGDRSVWVGAWSPDGALAATGSADGIVRIFPRDLEALVADACGRVGRELDPEELARAQAEPPASPRCPRR